MKTFSALAAAEWKAVLAFDTNDSPSIILSLILLIVVVNFRWFLLFLRILIPLYSVILIEIMK